MPAYKIHRIRENAFQHFRWAPHTSGASQARPKDYEVGGEIEAASPYAAWSALRDAGSPLRVGDIVEGETGELRIFKYVGFEEAHWVVPEVKPAVSETAPPESAPPASAESPLPVS